MIRWTFDGFIDDINELMEAYSSGAERFEMTPRDDRLLGELMYEIDMAIERVKKEHNL